jgi:hypothetical protein
VRAALDSLQRLLARDKPRRSRSLAIQLSILEDTCSDDDLCALARSLRAALS